MLFVFFSSLIKDFLENTVLSSLLLKLAMLVFLKCFLICASFEPHVSFILVFYLKKKCVDTIVLL